jgi:hypothetical protein
MSWSPSTSVLRGCDCVPAGIQRIAKTLFERRSTVAEGMVLENAEERSRTMGRERVACRTLFESRHVVEIAMRDAS